VKIAIIGAGNVGGTLGTAWATRAGHEVFFGVRSPNSDPTQALLRALGGKVRAGAAADAAAFDRRCAPQNVKLMPEQKDFGF
jgi:8-hydroxy-5-deazaflavin:NADPH oxidoreductase